MSTTPPRERMAPGPSLAEPSARQILVALGLAIVLVGLTRGPLARSAIFDKDDYLSVIRARTYWFPPGHTLYLTGSRLMSLVLGDAYRGLATMSMVTSALALVAVWWWLRAVVAPRRAATATLVLAVSPLFWSYGELAASYTAIPLVGALLLGLAVRSWEAPRPWHAYLAAVVLAIGVGYRQDIGMLWAPVFVLVLWRQPWVVAVMAGELCGLLILAWFLPMLADVGGWSAYQEVNREFAYSAGYLNSVWNLGLIDGPCRYAVKLGLALILTFGPALAFAPRGLVRLAGIERGGRLAVLLLLSILPALSLHLLVHFGVPGYAFHYVPALLALIGLGAGRAARPPEHGTAAARTLDRVPIGLGLTAALLAAFFLLYPSDYQRPGLHGDFDVAYGRFTRIGLRTVPPLHGPASWRTINSFEAEGVQRARTARTSLSEVFSSLSQAPTDR